MRELFNKIDEVQLPDKITGHVRALEELYVYIKELKNKIDRSIDSKIDKNEIIFGMRQVAAEVYSCCEIINELFRNMYRDDI